MLKLRDFAAETSVRPPAETVQVRPSHAADFIDYQEYLLTTFNSFLFQSYHSGRGSRAGHHDGHHHGAAEGCAGAQAGYQGRQISLPTSRGVSIYVYRPFPLGGILNSETKEVKFGGNFLKRKFFFLNIYPDPL